MRGWSGFPASSNARSKTGPGAQSYGPRPRESKPMLVASTVGAVAGIGPPAVEGTGPSNLGRHPAAGREARTGPADPAPVGGATAPLAGAAPLACCRLQDRSVSPGFPPRADPREMSMIRVKKAAAGVTVTFALDDTDSGPVSVVGDFNGWTPGR